MAKNKKGFTLVELLAVIVVLGILAGIAIPAIVGMVSKNRNEIYVQDAKKLITQAEYKLSSNSLNIEKPDPGEYIVLSYSYLDNGSFKNTPYGDGYYANSSFVMVKNNTGTMEYYVMLVEKINSSNYRGIKFSSLDQLKQNGHDRISNISSSNLVNVNSWTAGDKVQNKLTGNDLSLSGSISNVYKTKTDSSNTDVEDSHGPVIKGATIKTNGTKGFNTLSATLSLNITNVDEGSAKVCYYVSDTKNSNIYTTYASQFHCDTSAKNTYSHTFNFGGTTPKFNYTTKRKVYVYLKVYDVTDNQMTKKMVSYEIHENEAPKVNFSLSKRSSDSKQTNIARITPTISDDIDKNEDLYVCITTRSDCSSVTGCYKKYNDYFSKGYYDYPVGNMSSGTQTVNVRVCAKDTNGAATGKNKSYAIAKNDPPTIDSVTLNPVSVGGKNGLVIRPNISVTDDISSNENITLTLQDKSNSSIKATYKYSDFLNMDVSFTFGGLLDGQKRTLVIIVKDEHNASSTKEVELNNIYSNVAPTINSISITGKSAIPNCAEEFSCSGSYDVNVVMDVSDDLSSNSELMYCFSETGYNCTYRSYASYNGNFTFSVPSGTSRYARGSSAKRLYVMVKDSYGTERKQSYPYSVYANQPPLMTGAIGVSAYSTAASDEGDDTDDDDDDEKIVLTNNANVFIDLDDLSVLDDFSNYTLKLCYKNAGTTTLHCYNDTESSSVEVLQEQLKNGYVLKNSSGATLSGGTINVCVQATDNFGDSSTLCSSNYELPANQPPVIDYFQIRSQNGDYNSLDVIASFIVNDPGDMYQICFTTNSSTCSNYFGSYSGDAGTAEVDENIDVDDGDSDDGADAGDDEEYEEDDDAPSDTETYEFNLNDVGINWGYEDSSFAAYSGGKSIYLYVKDSAGAIVKKAVTYRPYQYCDDYDITNVVHTPPSSGGITHSLCHGNCYVDSSATGSAAIKAKYKETLSLHDTFYPEHKCSDMVNEVEIGCDYYTCVGTSGTINNNLIGITEIPDTTAWHYTVGGKTYRCTGHYNIYRATVKMTDTGLGYVHYEKWRDKKVCAEAIDNYNKYAYSSTASSPNLRFDDSDYVG